MPQRAPLTAEERALPYAKFYDLPITPIPEEKLAVLSGGPMDPALAMKIEDRNDLFLPGDLPCSGLGDDIDILHGIAVSASILLRHDTPHQLSDIFGALRADRLSDLFARP